MVIPPLLTGARRWRERPIGAWAARVGSARADPRLASLLARVLGVTELGRPAFLELVRNQQILLDRWGSFVRAQAVRELTVEAERRWPGSMFEEVEHARDSVTAFYRQSAQVRCTIERRAGVAHGVPEVTLRRGTGTPTEGYSTWKSN